MAPLHPYGVEGGEQPPLEGSTIGGHLDNTSDRYHFPGNITEGTYLFSYVCSYTVGGDPSGPSGMVSSGCVFQRLFEGGTQIWTGSNQSAYENISNYAVTVTEPNAFVGMYYTGTMIGPAYGFDLWVVRIY
ncbi:hypothetical protein [Crucivirus-506]|nr:hypothetical protein [Crucivirus-505]QMW68996.1 hypothetical protein [Crucivirus-506]